MARFIKTGVIEHGNKHAPRYGFATSMSYHEAKNLQLEADDMFAELPSRVRARFANDPAVFLKFCEDPKNIEKLVDIGDEESTPPWKKDPDKAETHIEKTCGS